MRAIYKLKEKTPWKIHICDFAYKKYENCDARSQEKICEINVVNPSLSIFGNSTSYRGLKPVSKDIYHAESCISVKYNCLDII